MNLYVENEPPEGTGRIRLASPAEILEAARSLADMQGASEKAWVDWRMHPSKVRAIIGWALGGLDGLTFRGGEVTADIRLEGEGRKDA